MYHPQRSAHLAAFEGKEHGHEQAEARQHGAQVEGDAREDNDGEVMRDAVLAPSSDERCEAPWELELRSQEGSARLTPKRARRFWRLMVVGTRGEKHARVAQLRLLCP